MYKILSTPAFTFILIAATAGDSNAAIIAGSGITATASSVNGSNDLASKTIDGSGMSVGSPPTQHASSTQQSWITAPMAGTSANGGISEQWIQWDLGASYSLDNIQVWNNNHSSQKWGLHQVDVYFSNAVTPGDPEGAGSTNWTLWDGGNTILTPSTFANGYEGFDLETAASATLPGSSVRWVRFEVDSARSDTGTIESGSLVSLRMGLSEIQFYGTAIPEPSAVLLGVLGSLLLLRRRR